MKVFYKMKLLPTEGGLQIWTNKYLSVHETPCYHFCVADWQLQGISDDNQAYDKLKARHVKFKRVAKSNSRVAFDTEQKAYDNLIYLKNRQLVHMKRDMEFLNVFIKFNQSHNYIDLDDGHGAKFVPNTNDLVNEHYVFD